MRSHVNLKIELAEFRCPITSQIFFQPVQLSSCGHLFEEEALTGWMRADHRNSDCPCCKEDFSSLDIVPAPPLIKNTISAIMQKHADLVSEQYFSAALLEDVIFKNQENPHITALIRENNLEAKAVSAYLNRAIRKSDESNNLGAIADLTKAIELEPNNAGLFLKRGRLHAKLGAHQSAIADFNNAIKENPNSTAAYFARAKSHQELDLLEKAISDYKKTISLDLPNSNRVTTSREKITEAQEELEKRRAAVEAAKNARQRQQPKKRKQPEPPSQQAAPKPNIHRFFTHLEAEEQTKKPKPMERTQNSTRISR